VEGPRGRDRAGPTVDSWSPRSSRIPPVLTNGGRRSCRRPMQRARRSTSACGAGCGASSRHSTTRPTHPTRGSAPTWLTPEPTHPVHRGSRLAGRCDRPASSVHSRPLHGTPRRRFWRAGGAHGVSAHDAPTPLTLRRDVWVVKGSDRQKCSRPPRAGQEGGWCAPSARGRPTGRLPKLGKDMEQVQATTDDRSAREGASRGRASGG